jgi:hypothetical protein
VDLVGGEKGLFLSAVDPQDPAVVYARTSGGAQDRLLASVDGASFTELTRVDGAMLGFALSPDGAQVAIGGPLAGVRVAGRGETSFVQRRTAATTCLAWDTEGLHACGSGLAGDFVVGRSKDGGGTWTPLLANLADAQGPTPRCAATSPVATTCAPLWPAQRQQLLAIGSGAGGQGAAGCGGAGCGGGGVGAGGAAGATAGGAGVAPPPGEGSCGCEAPGRRARSREGAARRGEGEPRHGEGVPGSGEGAPESRRKEREEGAPARGWAGGWGLAALLAVYRRRRASRS